MRFLILLVGASLFGATPIHAASRLTDVTPANLDAQPLALRVQHEAYENGMIRFEIHVSDGGNAVSPNREGRFVLWADRVAAREDASGGATTRPPVRMAARVQEACGDESLCYEVQVHRDLLDRTTFTFRNFDPGGMPSFDGYEFVLGEFVEGE
jgi:hypothetical protein